MSIELLYAEHTWTSSDGVSIWNVDKIWCMEGIVWKGRVTRVDRTKFNIIGMDSGRVLKKNAVMCGVFVPSQWVSCLPRKGDTSMHIIKEVMCP